jgi:alpha-galactosidase
MSVEYASRIINAVVTNKPYVFNGNTSNRAGSLITNLPKDTCVEVPCVADASGVTPMFVGDLPTQCAALIRTNVNVQELVVEGMLTGNRRRILQAAVVDPNTAAQLTLTQIRGLVDDMFKAQEKWMPVNLR